MDCAGKDSFEQQIVIDIKAGSPPNLAAFPQPGLAANMAAIGGLVPLGDEMENWVKNNYAAGPSWVDLGTYPDKNGNDQFYGFFYNVNVKSLVWYVPENFEAGGYEIPKTIEELIALSDQIVKDGGTPLVYRTRFRGRNRLARNGLGGRHHAQDPDSGCLRRLGREHGQVQ